MSSGMSSRDGSKGFAVESLRSEEQKVGQFHRILKSIINGPAEQNRFQIGDILLFIYKQNQDSVLQVTKEAYKSCNTEAATAKFKDGYTSFMLNTGLDHITFISGNKENCHKKREAGHHIVMSDRSKNITPSGDFITPSPSYTETLEITPGNAASPCYYYSLSFSPPLVLFFLAAMVSSL